MSTLRNVNQISKIDPGNQRQTLRRLSDTITLANGLNGEVNTNTLEIAAISATLATGGSGTFTLAKLTGGGTNGSITFVNGLFQSGVEPT